MAYNLSKYKFQIGDRVSIDEMHGGKMQHSVNDKLVAEWDAGVSRTGTIVDVQKNLQKNTPPWIHITPDIGFGVFIFRPKEITHVRPGTPGADNGQRGNKRQRAVRD